MRTGQKGVSEHMMKILEAFGEPISYGGQESFVLNMLSEMDREHMQIDLLTPYYCDSNYAHGITDELGIGLYELGCSFAPGSLRSGERGRLRQFLCSHSYDVIHIHSGSNLMLALYAEEAYRAGIRRIIVHSHCTGIKGWKHSISKFLTSFSLRRYPTDYLACSMAAGYWKYPKSICRRRLRIICDGIDPLRFAFNEEKRISARTGLGVDEDCILIACVGRLTYQKNQVFLLELLQKIKAMSEDSVRYMLLFTGDGEDREMLKEKANTMQLTDAVIFTGAVDDTSDYYMAADLLAVPSRYEGFGIAALEGQAAGLQVIASDNLPAETDVTGSVKYISLWDRKSWIKSIMTKHERIPQQAERIADSEYNIKCAAKAVRSIYISEQWTD